MQLPFNSMEKARFDFELVPLEELKKLKNKKKNDLGMEEEEEGEEAEEKEEEELEQASEDMARAFGVLSQLLTEEQRQVPLQSPEKVLLFDGSLPMTRL